ncbi:kinase-like domain-containing protein [Cantharellus anzutake]|uniref:kinase-like domain-containing protein n=1 Tax=Cantharellus anzutake TaxID=1750568 RepID=UPI001903E3D1|nr:kinase-like domain-containing protein [Cantharellus anzutake]KAF8327479.1 kinase-like domain-containing protein [Cantharellus anzutake]
MKTWGGLRHENVAHLCGYIVEEVEGNVVTAGFVSPWCQNGSITTYLRLSPQADRFTLVRDVAYGLQYLHDHEPPIVHGDIKPDNILIGDDGRALITDFGLSETTDSFTTGQMSTNFAISGTVKYMAPELVGYYERKPIRTLESDIWAYGCTSIQILTDKLPYACKDNLQVFHLLLRGQPPFHWDLDVKHEHIFSRCCSQTPSDRPTISRIVGELEFLAPSNIVANNARICS